jgi:hypothetical protein
MKQILHIFRKDTRHLWLEILVSFGALATFAAFAPDQWDFSLASMHRRSFFPSIPLLLLLVPATWWLLIGRLIQSESLVGDRHFWLTRPYEWKNLLAAKALFVLGWIYVPFVLMQCVILKEAGFSPLTHAAEWTQALVFVSGCVILPLFVIAAITENFAHMTLTLVGGVAALIAVAYLTLMPPGGYESSTPYDHHIWIVELLIVGAVIVVSLQYAMRRVWLARAVAIGAFVLATGLGIVMAALRESQISRLYAVSGAAPLQLSLATERKIVHFSHSERPGMVYVEMTVDFSGVAPDTAVQIDDVKVTLDDPGSGWHWTAPWWSSQTQRILPGTHHGQVTVMMSREQLKRFATSSATMQLTLATTELVAGGDTTGVIPAERDFPVTGLGVCTSRSLSRFSNQLICRAPMSLPPLMHVSATWYPKACTDEERMPNSQLTVTAWSGNPYPGSLSAYANSLAYGVFPVRPVLVNLFPDWHDGYDLYRTVGYALCPGTVVHFRRYAATGRTQVSIAIPSTYFQTPQLKEFLDDKTGE